MSAPAQKKPYTPDELPGFGCRRSAILPCPEGWLCAAPQEPRASHTLCSGPLSNEVRFNKVAARRIDI